MGFAAAKSKLSRTRTLMLIMSGAVLGLVKVWMPHALQK